MGEEVLGEDVMGLYTAVNYCHLSDGIKLCTLISQSAYQDWKFL